MAFLEANNIGKHYPAKRQNNGAGAWVLEEVNISIDQGEFLAIIGPSGCGKSTLLKIMDGLLPPTEGEIVIRGQRVTEPGPDRAVVFQHSYLLPWRSALSNVEFGLECLGRPADDRRAAAMECLEMVGLHGYGEFYPAELSGGMQQRVGLARAYAIEPEIMLMDEPFGALDAQTRITLQGDLAQMCTWRETTTVLVTHDMEEALFLADRVAIMGTQPGRITEVIDVPFARPRGDELRQDPSFTRLRGQVWAGLKQVSAPRRQEAGA